MKKIITAVLAFVLCVSAFAIGAFAAPSGTSSLEGPGVVRAGDKITLTFYVEGTNIHGITGELYFDESQLQMQGTPSSKTKDPWKVEFNGLDLLAYDDSLEKAIDGKTAIFSVTFKVNSDLAPGTKINVRCKNLTISDGSTETACSNATYSATLAAPASKDNSLKSMTVSNATISPSFSTDVTNYTAEVPYSVSSLDLKATASDSNARVDISGNSLKPGGTTDVKVTVTAENGDKKVYTITVKREQDPNYVPSGNNDLGSISVDGFLLSPVFSKDIVNYVIWLPYETDHVTVTATAKSTLASVQVIGGEELTPGADNEIRIICTAENGEQKVYTVIAKRASAHGDSPDVPGPSDPTLPSNPTAPTLPSVSAPTEPQGTQPQPTEPGDDQPVVPTGMPLLLVLVIACLCLAAGIAIGFVIGKKE